MYTAYVCFFNDSSRVNIAIIYSNVRCIDTMYEIQMCINMSIHTHNNTRTWIYKYISANNM